VPNRFRKHGLGFSGRASLFCVGLRRHHRGQRYRG